MTAAVPLSELDRFAPRFQFRERHGLAMRATPERVRRAIHDVTADEIFLFRTLIWIRRLGRPLPLSVRSAPKGTPLHEIGRATFVTLADGPREIVSATVVERPSGTARPMTPAALDAARALPGYAIATMAWEIAPSSDGMCHVTTETRVFATDGATRLGFGLYWLVIRAGSGFIRRMWLRAVRKRAETA